MTITTLDGALAGMQPPRFYYKSVSATLTAGRPHSPWPLSGVPGAGSYDATLNGAILTGNAVAGQMPRTDPVANAYLGRLSGMAQQAGLLLLCDRLWQNRPAITSGSQSITSPTWPARDVSGSTNGDGVLLGLEFSTANTAGTPAAPVTYTNQGGTGSHTANLLDAISATSAIGAFHRFELQAGDTGVRSVQAINLASGLTTAVINLVAYRIIGMLELTGASIPNSIDALTGGFPRIYNGSVPFFLFIPNTTTATWFQGSYIETQG